MAFDLQITNAGKGVEGGELSYTLGAATVENSVELPQKIKNRVTI